MHTAENYDAAVVGAGLAGSALALQLARGGLRVVLLDAATFPRQKVCGEYLSAAAWRRLAELGLPDLFEQAVPLVAMRLTADDRIGVEAEYRDPQAAPRSLSRYLLDARLVEEARRAGVTVLTGHRVRHVIVEDGRARALECRGEDVHSAVEQITARLIVAADGRRSTVVRDTGQIDSRDAGLWGFKRHVRASSGFDPQRILMHALPGGYIGTSVVENGLVNVCGVMPRRLIQEARGDVAAALHNWLAYRPELQALVADPGDDVWHTIPEVSQQRSRPTAAGVLYLGDAMGTIEPLTGQGMTMALYSAHLASQVIERFGVANIEREAQQFYAQAWQKQFAGPIKAASWFARILHRPRLLKAMIASCRPIPGLANVIYRAAYRRTLTVGT